MLTYLHIPFCDSKCPYCGFNSYTNISSYKKVYMKAICNQLLFEIEKLNLKYNSLDSVFIGGGTPSCIDAKDYENFFYLIKPFLKKNAEITIEANPNSAHKSWLKALRHLGINRISFGVQSFQKEKLQLLGRSHSPKQAIQAIHDAFDIGIKNISLDLIYGTKLDSEKLLEKDINKAFSLPINHLSAYSLTLEENTPFENKEELINTSSSLARFLIEKITKKFKHYEISNFGEYQSRHNLGYWQGKEYIGLGAGAVGFYKDCRYYPYEDVKKYIQNPLHVKIEKLSKEDINLEKIFLGLRSWVGIDLSILDKKQQAKANILLEEERLILKENRVYNKDFLFADEIALFLIS